MMMVALVCAVSLLAIALTLIVFGRTRRRPAALPTEVNSMRLTLERKVREGADFRL